MYRHLDARAPAADPNLLPDRHSTPLKQTVCVNPATSAIPILTQSVCFKEPPMSSAAAAFPGRSSRAGAVAERSGLRRRRSDDLLGQQQRTDAGLPPLPGQPRALAPDADGGLRGLCLQPPRRPADRGIDLRLRRSAAGGLRCPDLERGGDGALRHRRVGGGADRGTGGAGPRHRRCAHHAGRGDPRHRSRAGADRQQHHALHRPQRRQPWRRGAGHLRTGPGAAGLRRPPCPVASSSPGWCC